MKKIVIPSSIDDISKYLKYADGFILGIKDLCINMPSSYELDEFDQIIKTLRDNNKEIFINLNKNMTNKDLIKLEQVLIKLNDYIINGVIFYDMAIPNLVKKLNLKYNLVWSEEHMTNNYFTINYWEYLGINYTILSSDITLDEILEIRKNTSSKLMVNVFGYQPIFASFRHLVKSYLDTFKIDNTSGINYIKKDDKIYPIIDDKLGTVVYSSNILEALEETIVLDRNNIDYIILNSFKIDTDKFIKVLKIFNDINEHNVNDKKAELSKLFNNLSKNFLYNETIYRVKRDE